MYFHAIIAKYVFVETKSTDSVQISDKRRLSSFPIVFFALLFYSVFALNYHPVKTIAPQKTKVNIAKIEEIISPFLFCFSHSLIKTCFTKLYL